MNILVVDDNPENVYMLETLLKGNGYEVSTAANGNEALERLKQEPAELIISDILMPKMDGFQLCRAVKADDALKDIPFIFYTATYTTEKDKDFALNLGANRFILKPADPDEFISIIKNILTENETGLLKPGNITIENETEYLKRHQARLINKLEDKITALESSEERYRRDVSKRKLAEEEHLSHLHFLESLERVDQAIGKTGDLERTLRDVLDTALSIFDSDRSWLAHPCDPEAPTWHIYLERTSAAYPGAYGSGIDLPTTPDVRQAFLEMLNSSSPLIYDPRSGRALPEVARQFNVQSQIQTAVYPKIGKPWVFGMHQCSHARVWSDNDTRLFTEIARRIADSLSNLLFLKDLRESEARLRTLVKTIPDLVWLKDINGVYLACNPTFERLYGAREADILGKTDYDFVGRELADFFRMHDRRAMEAGKPSSNEEWLTFAYDGHRALMETIKTPMYDAMGNVTGVLGIARDITDRTRAEDALRESETRYRSLFDNMLEGFAYCKIVLEHGKAQDFVYLAVNEAFEKLTGLRDVVGKKVTEAIPGIRGTNPELFEIYGRVASTGIGERFETFSHAFGGWLSVSVYSTEKEHFVAVFDNITERKRAEEKLRENESRLRTLLKTIPDMVWLKNINGMYMACNPVFERFFGAREADIIGKTDYDFIKKELADVFRVHDRKAMEAGKPSSQEDWITFADDGRRVLMDTIKTPMYDAGGDLIGVLGIARDITERKQAEEALAAGETKFRKLYQEFHGLLDAVPDSLMLLDKDLKVLWANRVAADFIGADPEALNGHHCHFLWYKLTTHCEPCPVIESFSTGRPVSVSVTRPDGRIFDIRTVPLRDEGGNIARVIEVVREVTEHNRLEAQYLQAQKMESIGTLAGGVAHDFNNILSAIIGYSHVTLMDMAEDSPQRTNMEHILEAADRAARLTKELLLFSRKHITERKSVDLNEVVGTVEKFLRMVIGEDIECKTVLQGRSIPVYADSHQLEQVLMNLATNARDAMPGGGSLTIKTEQVNLAEDFIRAHGYGKSGLYGMITVSDTGAGIDEATQKRIFEPFFTTKEVGKGTGLGLAVVYGIIKQHDGFINVYSEPGIGTTFRIYLPIIGEREMEGTKAQQLEVPARGTETILLAEDDENLRKLSRTVLTEFGYTVIEAVDGEEAVKKFRENRDAIQLLLFDLVMPKMNGKEASDEIKKIKPDMKVVFASGYDPALLQQKELLGEGVHLVYKPISPMDLLRKVRSVLEEKA